MEKPAAFSATYSGWKVVGGRKVVQLIFEIPLEKADEAYQALGGMPDNSVSTWCAIARMAENQNGGADKDIDTTIPDYLRRAP